MPLQSRSPLIFVDSTRMLVNLCKESRSYGPFKAARMNESGRKERTKGERYI